MIDEYNDDRTGWARFSDDMTMRYHLGRIVSDRAREIGGDIIWQSLIPGRTPPALEIAVFLMLNPSDATAFRPDPTVGECVKFTRRWGHDITWVVNEHAFRSPYPGDLKKLSCGMRGDDVVNNQAIMTACSMATVVVTAWGNDGALDHRDRKVLGMLRSAGIRTHHLGLTKAGHPKHPLARGRHRIPADQQPTEFCYSLATPAASPSGITGSGGGFRSLRNDDERAPTVEIHSADAHDRDPSQGACSKASRGSFATATQPHERTKE